MHGVHGAEPASRWVQRWSHLVPRGARVLDVACGAGRHVRWFAERGCAVTGVDRDRAATQPLRAIAEIVDADIENGPWPFEARTFDAVVVTNYLWRPLAARIVASVADAGTLIWETFALGNETLGKPSNPDFLLRPAELLQFAAGLRVVAYEHGVDVDPPRFVQRIAAVREPIGASPPGRHMLSGGGS